jgi:aspartate carbamoyltransferase catalytic subunit
LKIAPGQNFPSNWHKKIVCRCYQFFSSTIICEEGETLIDTVNNILSMKVDMVVMRHANPGAAYLSKKCKSIINAGDGAHEHPTQGY